MNEETKKFLEQDNIDMTKFLANSEIFRNETKEIYQATVRLNNANDISDNATVTIHWMALKYNQPLGYPVWFMTFKLHILRKIVDAYKTNFTLECC